MRFGGRHGCEKGVRQQERLAQVLLSKRIIWVALLVVLWSASAAALPPERRSARRRARVSFAKKAVLTAVVGALLAGCDRQSAPNTVAIDVERTDGHVAGKRGLVVVPVRPVQARLSDGRRIALDSATGHGMELYYAGDASTLPNRFTVTGVPTAVRVDAQPKGGVRRGIGDVLTLRILGDRASALGVEERVEPGLPGAWKTTAMILRLGGLDGPGSDVFATPNPHTDPPQLLLDLSDLWFSTRGAEVQPIGR